MPHETIEVVSEAGAKVEATCDDFGSLGGAIFIDGSCTTETGRAMSRAAWAVGKVDAKGALVGFTAGALPADWPQTAQAAEHYAAGAAAQLARADSQVLCDCQGVVGLLQLVAVNVRSTGGVSTRALSRQCWGMPGPGRCSRCRRAGFLTGGLATWGSFFPSGCGQVFRPLAFLYIRSFRFFANCIHAHSLAQHESL